MAYALGSLSDAEYMKAMGGAFGGGDMGAVDEFLNSTYELPDVQPISFYIFEQVTKYMQENLPNVLGDEQKVDAVVFAVQEELRADRGPDFYKLPVLFGELGVEEEVQKKVIEDLFDFLQRELVNGVKAVEGVPNDVRTLMTRALKGALDYVMNDIRPDGQEYIDFFTLIPEFQMAVGELLTQGLLELDFANPQLIDEVLNEVGY
jgi:hypothetical protein